MNKNLTIYNQDQRSDSARDEDRKSSPKPRLLTRVGIVSLLLIAVITLLSLPALAQDKSRAPKKVRTIKGNTKDLRDIVKKVEDNAKAKESIRRTRSQIKDRMKDLDSKDRLQNFEIQR